MSHSFDARGISHFRTTLMLLNFDLEVLSTTGPPRVRVHNEPAASRFVLEMTPSSQVRLYDVDRVERALLIQTAPRAGKPSFDGFFLLGQKEGLLFARAIPASAELCETSTLADAMRAL